MADRSLRRRVPLVAVALTGLLAACGTTSSPSVGAARSVDAREPPAARRWIELTEDLVRAQRPAPTTAARLYAYVATAYAEARAVGSPGEANEATRQVVRAVLPASADAVDRFATGLPRAPLTDPVARVVERLVRRQTSDGFDDETPPVARIDDADHWRGSEPLTPGAGHWQRWIVGGARFEVPPPTPLGSAAFDAELQQVQAAVQRRDARWSAVIEFWGGAPGSETPAGIWLNQFWDAAKSVPLDEAAFIEGQRLVAQTLADAFIETWQIKYSYWTARPDMFDGSLATAMPNPDFPGYVSGHSTVSAAAAVVLGSVIPSEGARFLADAAAARDSRLYAGIHFASDNEAGFALGLAVGHEVLARTGTS